jgi:hypothetical protein
VVRQLAEIGYQVRLVYRILRRLPDHCLLHGYPGKDSAIENFGTSSYSINHLVSITLNKVYTPSSSCITRSQMRAA